MKFGNEHGFSLVEAIVASVIAAIIAGVMLVVMNLNYRESNEGSADAMLKMQLEDVMDRIARDVRTASTVDALASGKQPLLRAKNAAGTVFSAYRINNKILEQSTDATSWTSITVGSQTVATAVDSGFIIATDWKSVSVNLPLKMTYKGKLYVTPIRGGMYRCRN